VKRRTAQWWTGACVVLTAVGAGVDVWAWPGQSGAAGASGAGPSHTVLVERVVGNAMLRRQGGNWQALAAGRRLDRGDAIRTGPFGQIVVRGPGEARLSLWPDGELRLGGDTPQSASYTLESGLLTGVVRSRHRTYDVGTKGGEAHADLKSATFTIRADGHGLLAVVTRKGEVGLGAKGDRVVVPAGKQAVALPGATPGDPLPIPTQVFLEADWPDRQTTATHVAVKGRTDTGAEVRVGGRPVAVASNGTFEADVPLREGPNTVVVLATDAAGNAKRIESPSITRVAKRPSLKVKARGSIWE